MGAELPVLVLGVLFVSEQRAPFLPTVGLPVSVQGKMFAYLLFRFDSRSL